MLVNKPRKCVVVAFRGTEQVKWRDFLTDVRVNPTAFNTERVRVSHKPKLDVIAAVRVLNPTLLSDSLSEPSCPTVAGHK